MCPDRIQFHVNTKMSFFLSMKWNLSMKICKFLYLWIMSLLLCFLFIKHKTDWVLWGFIFRRERNGTAKPTPDSAHLFLSQKNDGNGHDDDFKMSVKWLQWVYLSVESAKLQCYIMLYNDFHLVNLIYLLWLNWTSWKDR